MLVDGKRIEAGERESLINALRRSGFQIPSLCYDERTGSSESCGLCVVRVDGELRLSCAEIADNNSEIVSIDEEILTARRKALEKLLDRHYGDCTGPCRDGCPANSDIETYLRLTREGRYHEAVKVMKESYILPAVLGRVCPAFCEKKCRRELVDEPLAIRALKRFAADEDLKDPWMPEIGEERKERIAVLGSGPAGLACAYYLRTKGYGVTVFERMDKLGGMLRYGIPEYRLPRDVLDRDIETVINTGIEVRTGVEDVSIETLKEGYDAVFVATGAWKSTPMGIEGENLAIHGIEFLRKVNQGERPDIGKRVIVVGGGNTAIDAARTALRLGSDVTLVYRRSRAEMPANEEEVREAEEEGVRFEFLVNPVRIRGNYRAESVELVRMGLGEPDASGRRRPVPLEGSNFAMECDSIILALGQYSDDELLKRAGIKAEKGRAVVDELTLETGVAGVFCGGDIVLGPSTVIESIASGRRAATMIDLYLTGSLDAVREILKNPSGERSDVLVQLMPYNHWKDASVSDYKDVARSERIKTRKRGAGERVGDFGEVERGLTGDETGREAGRCLACGCGKSTECELRIEATLHGIEHRRLPRITEESFKNPFFSLDKNKCISCDKCVAVCATIQQCHVLDRNKRPAKGSFADSGCVYCGNCLSVCPTGAMVENDQPEKGREREMRQTSTICPYCGVGCSITMHTMDNRVIRVSSPHSSLNDGWLCVKGRSGFYFVNSEERLKAPMIRKDGVLVEVGWDEAMDWVTSKLLDIRKEHGGRAIAGFASAKCTNEENYLFQKFMRCAIGSNNVDHCARLCHAPTVVGLAKAFGSGAMTNTIGELERADCIFVVGSNTTETQPITAMRIKRAKSRGAKLIVADPRRTELAELADVHLRLSHGSDTALINAIMAIILAEGWEDREFIEQRTENFQDLEKLLRDFDVGEAERITGVRAEDMRRAAELYAQSRNSSIVYCMGVTQHTCGTRNVLAIADLAMLCGKIGRESTGVNPLRGQCNVQGACDVGALPEFFPGYQRVGDERATELFERAWGKELSRERGLTVEEILQSAEDGEIRALYIMGENPMISDPDRDRTEKALRSLELLVVQDIFLTETAELADVVLPAACFAEKDGTFTNTERRVQRLRKALEPPGQAREDMKIICDISTRMGYPMRYERPENVMEEISSLIPNYGGISYERLEDGGLQWPCPSTASPGTKYLHGDKFSRGRGRFHPVTYSPPAELPDERYPILLSTGRVLYHFHTGTMSRRSPGINSVFPEAIVEINPEDAEELGIAGGDHVRIISRRGSVVARANLSQKVSKGTAFMPFHFAEAPANALTGDALDEEAKTPEYKVSAVRIERNCY